MFEACHSSLQCASFMRGTMATLSSMATPLASFSLNRCSTSSCNTPLPVFHGLRTACSVPRKVWCNDFSSAASVSMRGMVSTHVGYAIRKGLVVRCGRGDKRTAKGKRFRGSFGNARPKNSAKGRGLGITPMPPMPSKPEFDDGDFVQVDIDESLFSG